MKKILGEHYPRLSQEWHPTKNGELTPLDVTCGSNKKVWWVCKHGHEWEAVIASRTRGRNCPYCSGKRVTRETSLAFKFPDLAKEWHPTKNGELTPSDVTCGSYKKVWWICEHGHEWEAVITSRTRGANCPYCSGRRVTRETSLATKFPNLAKEWHPTKNGELTPFDVTCGSNKKVWWKCKLGHEWEAAIANRADRCNCPYCSGKRVTKETSLAFKFPDLAKEWHPTKNGELTHLDVTCGSDKKVWWICEHGHEWEAVIASRTSGRNCPYCSGARVTRETSLAFKFPDLVKEWHPTKNGELTPSDVTCGSGKKVWWKCKLGHEWQATTKKRTRGNNCPHCSNNISSPSKILGYGLLGLFPELELEKRISNMLVDIYIKSLNLIIEYDGAYFHSSQKKAILDNKKSNKLLDLGFDLIRVRPMDERNFLSEIKNTKVQIIKTEEFTDGLTVEKANALIKLVYERICLMRNIPNSSTPTYFTCDAELWEVTKKRIPYKNSLLFLYPELASEWHPTKNEKLTPSDVTRGSNHKVWWICEQGHEWQAVVKSRTIGSNCPCCAGVRVTKETSLAVKFPDLAKEWHPTKNGEVTPSDVTCSSGKKAWWKCKHGHEWQSVIASRTRGDNCPYCSGKRVARETSLAVKFSDLVKEWHPTKNEELTPFDVTCGSGKKVWWKCKLGHEWQATTKERTRGNNCPYCSGKRVTRETSLAFKFPDLAKEWHPTKNGELTPFDVTCGSNKKVWWICEHGHEWEAVIASRTDGHNCPYCSGQRVTRETSLAFKFPNLAKEWHPTKNGELTPSDVTCGSNKKVWWRCEHGHEWQSVIASRTRRGNCPHCSRLLRKNKKSTQTNIQLSPLVTST